MCLARSLRNAAARLPHKPAVLFDDRMLTYAELDFEAERLARELIASGTKPGDRIVLHMHNGVEIAIAYFACFYAGAIAVPINPRMKDREIRHVIERSGSSTYVGQREPFGKLEEVGRTLRGVGRFIVDRRKLDVCSDHLAASTLPPVQADRPAVILYTSGSTALPKGVVHTHRSFLNAARGLRITADDVIIIFTPMTHSPGFAMLLAGIDTGATSAVAREFEPEAALDAIERHRGTYMLGLPAMYRALVAAQQVQPRHMTSLQRCLASGDTIPPVLQSDFARCFGQPLNEIFGSTETGLIAANWSGGKNRAGSVGCAAPGVDIAVVDSTGASLPFGAEGEMIVRSAANMIGYWNDEVATKAALINGWVRTGDLVRQDSDGYLWFQGRKKDIIVRGGFNVSPQEIEAVLDQHTDVREAGVVGAPDEVQGERVIAFVSCQPGREVTGDELMAFLAKCLSDLKTPDEVIVLEALPKNATGKVDRRALRERCLAADRPVPKRVRGVPRPRL